MSHHDIVRRLKEQALSVSGPVTFIKRTKPTPNGPTKWKVSEQRQAQQEAWEAKARAEGRLRDVEVTFERKVMPWTR
jgi:hypothetical protein